MPALKNETMSLRVSRDFKTALRKAAERERRSQTNLLEHLVFAYCEANGIVVKRAGGKKNTHTGE
jgi:hypothetical protein